MNEIRRRGFLKGLAGLAASIGVPFSTLLGALPYDGRKRKTTVLIENSPLGIDRNERITRYAHSLETGTSMEMTASRQWFQHYLKVLEKRKRAVLEANTLERHQGKLHQNVERMLMDGWEVTMINHDPRPMLEPYDLAKHRRLLAEKERDQRELQELLKWKQRPALVIEVFDAPLLGVPEGATNEEIDDVVNYELDKLWDEAIIPTPMPTEGKTWTWDYRYLPQSLLSSNKSDLFHSSSLGS